MSLDCPECGGRKPSEHHRVCDQCKMEEIAARPIETIPIDIKEVNQQERRELFKSVAIALVSRGIWSPEFGKDIAREILKAADEFEKEQEK